MNTNACYYLLSPLKTRPMFNEAIETMREWCEGSLEAGKWWTSPHYAYDVVFGFHHEGDALMFYMRWKGDIT